MWYLLAGPAVPELIATSADIFNRIDLVCCCSNNRTSCRVDAYGGKERIPTHPTGNAHPVSEPEWPSKQERMPELDDTPDQSVESLVAGAPAVTNVATSILDPRSISNDFKTNDRCCEALDALASLCPTTTGSSYLGWFPARLHTIEIDHDHCSHRGGRVEYC